MSEVIDDQPTIGGILCDPRGEAISIDRDEHRKLATHLEILREPDHSEHSSILYAVITNHEQRKIWREHNTLDLDSPWSMLPNVVRALFEDELLEPGGYNKGYDSVLVTADGKIDERLSADEALVLSNMLKVLRAGGWFGEWLSQQVAAATRSNEPDICHPSPLFIASTLVYPIEEFQNEVEETRKVIARRPDLFHDAIAPREPAAVPKKAPAPRKRAKKAA